MHDENSKEDEEEDEEWEDAPESANEEHAQTDDPLEKGEIVEESDDVHTPASEPEMATAGLGNHNQEVITEVESTPIINTATCTDEEDTCMNSHAPTQIEIDIPEPNNKDREPITNTSPAMIPLPGGARNLLDKRRRYHKPGCSFALAQSLQPIAYPWEYNQTSDPPLPAPQFGGFDLNNQASSYVSRADSSNEISESSNEFTSLLHIGNQIGFRLSKDDPVVNEIGNNGGRERTVFQ
ncbi:hypothetical protein LXL04_038594 [Taraxacum kok-saghyz]